MRFGPEYAGLSVCELILAHEDFQDLRPFVGEARAFWSLLGGAVKDSGIGANGHRIPHG